MEHSRSPSLCGVLFGEHKLSLSWNPHAQVRNAYRSDCSGVDDFQEQLSQKDSLQGLGSKLVVLTFHTCTERHEKRKITIWYQILSTFNVGVCSAKSFKLSLGEKTEDKQREYSLEPICLVCIKNLPDQTILLSFMKLLQSYGSFVVRNDTQTHMHTCTQVCSPFTRTGSQS